MLWLALHILVSFVGFFKRYCDKVSKHQALLSAGCWRLEGGGDTELDWAQVKLGDPAKIYLSKQIHHPA
jgi:hypothetical protein